MWNDLQRSDFLEGPFGKGYRGVAKTNFLAGNYLHVDRFQIPGNSTLATFLTGLKDTVSSRYDEEPSRTIPDYAPDTDGDTTEGKLVPEDAYELDLKRYNKRLGYMKDHSTMLRQFARVLGPSAHWPEDDKASPQPFVPSTRQA